MGITVAVTGATGEIGRPLLRALQRNDDIADVRAMARRPFDPKREGLPKVDYRQGDVTDVSAVKQLVTGADAVAHIAFVIFGDAERARRVNVEGSRNVFEAAFESGAKRLVYTSSIAAYGFHDDHPPYLTEDHPTRGSETNYYSAQKADVEKLLDNLSHSHTDVYVFRPCIVAGPSAQALIDRIPYVRLSEKLPRGVKRMVGALPLLRPVIPDPGATFQLVHEDDVAAALVKALLGHGPPGIYNLAADGEVGLGDLAHALGWYSVPVPEIAIDATASIVSRLPYLPAEARWVNAIKVPVLVDTTRARTLLGWSPKYDALETLAETVAAARARGTLPWPGR